MCGGRGTRLRGDGRRAGDDSDDGDRGPAPTGREKPLVEVGGEAMLDRVIAAVRGSRAAATGEIDAVHAVVSPHAPATAERARRLSTSVVETPGDGYVSDLQAALEEVGRPALTVPADLPLLASVHVDDAVERAKRESETDASAPSLTVCVPVALKRRLGASVDTAFEHGGRPVAPTGLNVVAGDDDTVALTYDARLAVNVNRPGDRELAEALCE
ncbi:NTP transferase domain-containing protein [Halobellus sp. GM3]|uniref:NTP transferase domain-containing protein n=1 Tax=Halobellus sp. GM3 TaxID=3458410 RepID=UPI00403DB4F3